MSRTLLRNLILSIAIAMMTTVAWADARDKVDTLLRDYGSISRDLHDAQQAQSELLKQKTILDDRGSDLVRRQDTLNAHPSIPEAPAAPQQPAPQENQSPCDNKGQADGKNAPGRANGCDNKSKKLKKLSLDASAGALPVETRQSELDLEYSRYDEAAHDWNAQEQQTVTSLNRQYRSMNDWADRAEGLITSGPFQAEVAAEHWQRYCPNRAMRSGVLSIDEVAHFADGYAKCLKYVDGQRRAAPHGVESAHS